MKTKHTVRAIHSTSTQEIKPKKTPRKQTTFFQKVRTFFSLGYEENEHTQWLKQYTRLPQASFYRIPPIELRKICERIDPIVVETLLAERTPEEQILILKELHPTVLTGFKPICREGDNKNNKPIERIHLISMVRNFSKTSLPPFVIGHPENDFPAFGYISRVKLIGEYLFGLYQDVPSQLEDLINDGFFNYVSISMSVPVQRRDLGHTKLKHVGLCGGTPPAVTKLGYLRFYEGDINNKRDGLNESQKEVIGASFASVPYFKKSPLLEQGYQLIATAFYPVRVDPTSRKFIKQILSSATCQEIPLIYYVKDAEDPPALGYAGQLQVQNNILMANFINIPEMVEGFVLEALEKYALELQCSIQIKNGKAEATLHCIALCAK